MRKTFINDALSIFPGKSKIIYFETNWNSLSRTISMVAATASWTVKGNDIISWPTVEGNINIFPKMMNFSCKNRHLSHYS